MFAGWLVGFIAGSGPGGAPQPIRVNGGDDGFQYWGFVAAVNKTLQFGLTTGTAPRVTHSRNA